MIGKVLKGLGIFAKAGIVSAVVASIAVPAAAEGLNLRQATAKSRAQQFDRQKQLMDSRLAKQYQQSKRLRPTGRQVVNVTTIELSPTISTKAYSGRRSAYMPHAQAVARKHGIPEALFLRLVVLLVIATARLPMSYHSIPVCTPATPAAIGQFLRLAHLWRVVR